MMSFRILWIGGIFVATVDGFIFVPRRIVGSDVGVVRHIKEIAF